MGSRIICRPMAVVSMMRYTGGVLLCKLILWSQVQQAAHSLHTLNSSGAEPQRCLAPTAAQAGCHAVDQVAAGLWWCGWWLQIRGAKGEGGWGGTERLPAPPAWRGACCYTHPAEGRHKVLVLRGSSCTPYTHIKKNILRKPVYTAAFTLYFASCISSNKLPCMCATTVQWGLRGPTSCAVYTYMSRLAAPALPSSSSQPA
ncbi:hypothetical protein V8C86DRAFT_909983 [Haematococcus lacustris]